MSAKPPQATKGPVPYAAVHRIIERARAAQARFARSADQDRYDTAACAAAWTLMDPDRNRALAEMAVETTGLGAIADKITKNHRKTLGLMRDLGRAKTCGIVAEYRDRGLTEIARPVGVVGAVVPSTNPVATPVNNIANALKCGNAIVLAPSPSGASVCSELIRLMHAEFDRVGVDRQLVQMLPEPPNKSETSRLMELVDLVIATGSQDNVRRAYASGTPAIGVGIGNVPVIVDETADFRSAAEMIAASKVFDNATSCSSENALIVVGGVLDDFLAALSQAGGALLSPVQTEQLVSHMWIDGKLNPDLIAKDLGVVLAKSGLTGQIAENARFLVAPADGVGAVQPLSGEKLSLVVALYSASDFEAARDLAADLLRHQGAGHSVGLHTAVADRALALGRTLPVCRVLVNQPHAFATGGAFDNGLPFSLSMGCGTWGGNSIDDNLHWRHFLNITRIVRTIPPDEPSPEDVFEGYWHRFGR